MCVCVCMCVYNIFHIFNISLYIIQLMIVKLKNKLVYIYIQTQWLNFLTYHSFSLKI